MTTIYCANDPCEAEATRVILRENGVAIPMCETCRGAFRWGQINSHTEIWSLCDDDVKVEMAPDGTYVYEFVEENAPQGRD